MGGLNRLSILFLVCTYFRYITFGTGGTVEQMSQWLQKPALRPKGYDCNWKAKLYAALIYKYKPSE